jgi:hypothetical protein
MKLAIMTAIILFVLTSASNVFAIRVNKSATAQQVAATETSQLDPQIIFDKIKPNYSIYSKIRADQVSEIHRVFSNSPHLIDQAIAEFNDVIISCSEKAKSSVELKVALSNNITNKVARDLEQDIDMVAMLLPELQNISDTNVMSFKYFFRIAKRQDNHELMKKTVACEIGYLTFKNNLSRFDKNRDSARIYNDIYANSDGRYMLSYLLNGTCGDCESSLIDYESVSGCFRIVSAMEKKYDVVKAQRGSLSEKDKNLLNKAYLDCKDIGNYRNETKSLSNEYIKSASEYLKRFK